MTDNSDDDIESLIDMFEKGYLDKETLANQIRFRMWDAYESGWQEATNGKWGPSEENPWPNPY